MQLNFSKTSKITAILIGIYILTLVGGFLFVKQALKDDGFEVQKKETKDKNLQEIKPVKVSIIIKNGNYEKAYNERMENNQTILDLIEKLRLNKEISFEKVAYTFGTELQSVNNINADENNKWNVYLNVTEQDVKDQIKNLNLSDKEIDILNKATNNDYKVTFEIESVSLPNNAQITLVYENITK